MWEMASDHATNNTGTNDMRIMYLAPRFHTNQAAVIKGWQEHGDETEFVVRKVGRLEDHSIESPTLLPYTNQFQILYRAYLFLHHNSENAKDFDLRYGYPSTKEFSKLVKKFKPDLVILREKSIYSMVCYRVLRKYGICTILYNQSPLYAEKSKLQRDWKHRLVDRQLPKIRITPVLTSVFKPDGKLIKDANCYFVPFIVEPACPPEKKTWFSGGNVRILEVGKFERRKNHLLMLNSFEKLLHEAPNTTLMIVGEVSNRFHEAYLKEIMEKIEGSKTLKGHVAVRTNVPHSEMNAIYQNCDLYVLPSTGEPAAYSILEAMANSVAAVCSTDNGTASYIEPGINGDIFRDKDEKNLTETMLKCIQDRRKLVNMGENAYKTVCKKFVFCNYYDSLFNIPMVNNLKRNNEQPI